MRWTQPNFAVASWATLNIWGNMGCVITGVAHGLSSSALFILLAFISHKMNIACVLGDIISDNQ